MLANQIHVVYGNEPIKMTKELLTNVNLAQDIKPGSKVALKPNLVVARPAVEGATTSPLIVEGIIQYLLENGIKDISVVEGSWVGDSTTRAFQVCGYERIAQKYNIPLVDLKKDQVEIINMNDLNLKVCKTVLAADYLINLPVLKAHCQTLFTCALKNLKGCIPDSEKRRYHSLGLHKPIAHLAKAIKVDLNIIDGLNGDLTFEEGGNPVQMDRIIAAKDPVLVDSYCSSLLGYTKNDIKYIRLAEELGVGNTSLEKADIVEYNTELKSSINYKPSNKAAKLAKKAEAKDACSACYGSLIHALNRLDEQGKLSLLKKKILIGQGYQDQKEEGLGIGQCTSGCPEYLKGCPPKAIDIVHFLEDHLA